MSERRFDDRRSLELRVGDVERQLGALMERIDESVAPQLNELLALKQQITGMVNLVKFVGWSGFVAIVAVALRLVTKGL